MKSITTVIPCVVIKEDTYKNIREMLSPIIISDMPKEELKELVWDIDNQFTLLDTLGVNKTLRETTTKFKSNKDECFYVLYDEGDNLDVVLTTIEKSRLEKNYRLETDMSFYSKRSLNRVISDEYEVSVWFTLSTDKNASKQSVVALWSTDKHVIKTIHYLLNKNTLETI